MSALYVLDANVFIQAHRRHYPFDVFPVFWKFLKEKAQENKLCSIDRVKDELNRGNDELKSWALTSFSAYFASTQIPEVLNFYSKIANLITNNTNYSNKMKNDFLAFDCADPWLIAFAGYYGYVLVTEESVDRKKEKIRIPAVCDQLKVRHCNTVDMLRSLGFKY